MKAASWPGATGAEKLLLPGAGSSGERVLPIARLDEELASGDVLVVNDSATLPASLRSGELELRLAAPGETEAEWWAIVLGRGDWRLPTERRGLVTLQPGQSLVFVGGLVGRVVRRSSASESLILIEFDRVGAAWLESIYQGGRPIQYSYARAEYPLYLVQTPVAGRPWSVEMPSASRALSWALIEKLRQKSVQVVSLTHGCGLSSSGDPRIDALLPLPEPYEIPEATISAIHGAKGRVIAVGTSVVRALEDAALKGFRAGRGMARLRIGSVHTLQVVDGILTGMHEGGESHFDLLEAFRDRRELESYVRSAEQSSLEKHEFGDFMLVWRRERALAGRSA